MPDASPSPVQTDVTVDAPAPVVHLTRRARIEAERTAARSRTPAATDDEFAAIVGAPVDAVAPASPIDLAPASPVRPAPIDGTATPPAPSSPDVGRVEAVPSTAGRPVRSAPGRGPVRPGTAQRGATRGVQRGAARGVQRGATRTGVTRPGVTRPAPSRAQQAAPGAASGSAFRRTASRVTAVGALLFAAGLVVSTSLPAQALWTPEASTTAARTATDGSTQSLSVGDAGVSATDRDQYTVSDATQYAHTDSSAFTNDAAGTIQWPFLTGVPITSGFGGRQVAGCSFCSTNHQGVDFAPGEGTPIRVVADGVVTKVQANDGGFGNDVWVTHDVDGKQFVSVYGHMKDNTFKVVTGQHVSVGDELGEVGSTGNSTGPHLHLEIHVDGVPVDPLAWLEENAN